MAFAREDELHRLAPRRSASIDLPHLADLASSDRLDESIRAKSFWSTRHELVSNAVSEESALNRPILAHLPQMGKRLTHAEHGECRH
jgi:hypothetical protein